ncbi:MAG TPA: PQQ-dependent dehydrogenase, methanol/ethanol family [Bryobacteraceae bacterium]|nr:PQQ-dependent dehydrogenase, methanol/ethanol family [Bryobacteraceae bacterium]
MKKQSLLLLLVSLPLAAQVQSLPPVPPTPPPPMPEILKNYKTVTAERLARPEDGDWLMIRRTWNGWGYSPLNQITTANVKQLQPVWVMSTGVTSGHEAPPIVNNGVMFIATPGGQVIAADAKTGAILWRYRHPLPEDLISLHPTSRGIALFGDKLYYAGAEAVLIAIDVKTGKEVWKTRFADNQSGYYTSLAPIVAGGKVMLGCSGGELGIRGFVAAFDPETGKEAWRTYTVPAPGEPGSETWPAAGDQWKNGGGPVWVSGNYDPETNLAYWGAGNGGPWMGDQRPGDNLYTASTIAIDVATGQIRGYFQYHPNDSWDWDEVSPPILVDFQRNGKTLKGLIDVARDGYMRFLERTEGPIHFVDGQPYVKQNAFFGLDPKTGRANVNPEHKPGTGKTVDFCPSLWGGKNWPPIAFSPETRMIYIPANENLCETVTAIKPEYSPGRAYTGTRAVMTVAPGADHIGEVQAWNVDTGQKVWTHTYASSENWGSMLATAGGLVFSGGTNDRMLHAFDAKTGELLWQFPTSSGILAPPVSFMVDGKQYIAVESGWGVDSRSMQTRLNVLFPGQYPEVPEGGSVWVFALQ